MRGQGNTQGMLSPYRVLDLTDEKGLLCGKLLEDLGAEVIKIESQKRPDGMRWLGPFKDNIPGLERGGAYNFANSGKLGVSLNLTYPKGIEIAKRLIALSDIVVENYSGGTIQRMGLGYEELRKVRPDIIMLSACMQGQTGPHASHPGYGPHLTALSGFTHIAGWLDRDGADLGVYTDYIAPHFIALAVLSALDYRRRTGKGQYIDMSQYESSLHFMAPLLLDNVTNQRVADRMGNRHAYAVPHNAYPCRGEDRWCAIGVFTDEEWQSLVKVMGDPAWADDPRFATFEARKENEEDLDRLIGEWTIEHPAEEVMNLLQAAGVAAGVLENGQDMLEGDPQLKHRHTYWEVDHPVLGTCRSVGPAFILSKSPCEVRRGPLLGEHNEYALKELLGMSDEEIEELVIEGVVE
jgi:benzylsuccinate CoA-transferase BbsF subunit